MTHTVWYGLWRAVHEGRRHQRRRPLPLGFVGLVVGAIVIAWLMWRFVEEPAREWMRKRTGERPKPVEEIALENG